MKHIFFLMLFFTFTSLINMDLSSDMANKIRFKKACQASVYAKYEKATEYPDLYDDMISVFRRYKISAKDVTLFTAKNMNNYVEKLGNSIIVQTPHFFIYWSKEEQNAAIATQLEKMQTDDPEQEFYDGLKDIVKKLQQSSSTTINQRNAQRSAKRKEIFARISEQKHFTEESN